MDGPEEWRASAAHVEHATHIVNASEDYKTQLRLAMKAATDDEAELRLAKTNVRHAALPEPAPDMPAAVSPEPVNVDEKPIHMKTGGRFDSDSDTDTDPEMPGLLSVLESSEGSFAGVGGERVSAAGGGGGTDDGQQGRSPASPTAQEQDLTCNLLCGTIGRDCGLHLGRTHVGPICLKALHWEGNWLSSRPRELVTVVVCAGTGQVMHCPEIAEAYNLDGLTQVRVAASQQKEPWVFSDYTYSSDSDAEANGQDRVQPETETILANVQPRCPRYFYSSCRDCLFDMCEPFKLRYMLMVWKDYAEEAYADMLYHRENREARWIRQAREHREAAEASVVDQVAAVQAFLTAPGEP